MHHTLPSAETYHSNAPFFTSSKGLLCGLVGVLEETYFSERCQDEGRQGSIFSGAQADVGNAVVATDTASVDAECDNG